ncbi:D-alanyl-lipoteichoic acid acyltransferase DltB, MBOAT superfamily [Lentimicrobium saccharophilum]|uniref:D-alanyl-lipoteichoic acid acyltransferase DltB, MBOAT superfamily n=1 Tax=Lentimicrobium saccharophilum TaxID=1678841 RepID=A0A0S7C3Y5_9BACT|nr:MBOAT family O-acyltransferase [Lentimicrobium saccharophilum]GAP44150.1 D-alanyl-lipoteichoic acid acyltransferase DltB, MBOAT superfamily [Lentimicrobium saccharophilum]
MNRLKEIFAFSDEFPLIFTQADFWIFFTALYLIFSLIYKRIKLRNTYLLLVSLFFYYKTSGLFVGLLVFTTISNFYLGAGIFGLRVKALKLTLLSLSVALNLFILSYFKYSYFIVDSLNYLFGTSYHVSHWLAEWGNSISNEGYFTVDKIILPIGISFYLFQTITYCVDIYRGKLKPLDSVADFGLFVTFFPQLVAGPIVRAGEFIPQISKPTVISAADFNSGTFLILKGLLKKMIFADYLAMHFMDKVFDAPAMFSGFTNIMALFGYSLQIYGDFSGYTDIAIGLALLMGFRLPVNFNSPYKAQNTSDFWRRWHISLSSFLRDYLYIPLGGNRNATIATVVISVLILAGSILAFKDKTAGIAISAAVMLFVSLALAFKGMRKHFVMNINIMLTMLIGGLWHGASWKFVIWGGLNGLGILTYKYWRRISPWEKSENRAAVVWKIMLTFTFITFTRLYFRGESMEHISAWYRQVADNMDWSSALQVLYQYRIVFVIMLLGYITHWLPVRTKESIENLWAKSPLVLKGIIAVITGIVCYQAYSASFQPFIYFQF